VTASAEETGRAARLRPDDILRYLSATGWQRTRDYGRGQIWALDVGANGHGQPYEVLVPLDQRLRDYALRMADLLETVAAAEQRDPRSVLGDLDLRWADVLYARLHTLSLAGLAPALTGLRDLMLSAAKTVEPKRAWEQVRKTQVGTSRTGAPLITVRTALSQEPGEPFERRVTRTVYEGVSTAWGASSGDPDAHTYFAARNGHAPSRTVPPEIGAALARIGGRAREGFELRFAWSPDVPFKAHQLSFEFTPAMLGEVARVARRG
jgi:hypothetical protein